MDLHTTQASYEGTKTMSTYICLEMITRDTIFDSMEEVNTGRNIINSVNVLDAPANYICTTCGMVHMIGLKCTKLEPLQKQLEKASKEADYERAQGVVK